MRVVRQASSLVAAVVLAVAASALLLALELGEQRDLGVEAGPPNATAHVIADSADLIEGPLSRGQIGDYLLANGEIQVVIQRPLRAMQHIATFGGQIIDGDLVRSGGDPERDTFEEWAVGINVENTGHYTSVAVINDGTNGQPAVIRATGVDDLLDFINPSSQVADFGFPFPAAFDDTDLPIEVTTDYILAPNDPFVQVETTVRNTDPSDTIDTFITDLLSGSGQLEFFQPGYGFGEPLVTSACSLCNFSAWSGYDDAEGVSYGFIHDIDGTTTFTTGGVAIPLLGEDVALALTGFAPPNFAIPPNGGEVTVTRYFAIGDGTVGSIVDIRNQILGLSTGTLDGSVTRAGQPVAGVDVTVLGDPDDGPGTDKHVVAHYETDASGAYQGTLPPGDYTVQAHLDGHLAATPDPGSVSVTDAGTTTQDFTIPESGRLQVTIEDETDTGIAGKVSIIGFDPYTDPGNTQTLLGIIENETAIFGEATMDPLPFGLAGVLFVGTSGDSGEIFIEPGDYRVVISHGTEYSVYEEDVTITAGSLTTVNAQVAPVIDTSGFVSGDFHVHQLHSPDSAVTLEDRVVSMIAEGMDFFTPSDHEHRTDLAPVVSAMGAGGLISVAVNSEHTTPDYGHFNAWPLTTDPSLPNNGALDWGSGGGTPPPAGQDFPSFGYYNMAPGEIFAALLADPGVDTVQINHADTFFGPGGLAIDTTFQPPQDFADNLSKRLDPGISNLFDDAFTALEVWQGTDRNNINNRFLGRNAGDWFNMINQGIIRTGIAVSDTHKEVVNPAGFPRTFLASPTDDPSALGGIADTLAGNVNDGRAIGTNGPFIRVTSEATSTSESGGLGLGEPTLISTTGGSATITVDIQSPLWAEFDTVEYYVNHVPFPNEFDNDPVTPPYWQVTPEVVQAAGTDFMVNTVDDYPLIAGASHLEATTSLDLTGLTDDTWVVVVVRGSDGVSEPIFPIAPTDLNSAGNTTLEDLTDGNLGEGGVPAVAFSNPLFIDVDGNDEYDTHPVDNDRDGCTNDQELATGAMLGGGRRPSSFWDFFDANKDKAVSGLDFFAVLSRFNATAPGYPTAPAKQTALLEALSAPPAAPAYHASHDRRPPAMGADPWDTRSPDGAISGIDFFLVLAQFNHSCV